MAGKGSFDRDDILARTDLADLADELAGPSKGMGEGRRWPSPTPGHEQTGKTPPMSIFTTRYGEQRWTCFATGASGTAIDLVMTTTSKNFRESIEWLADRSGVSEQPMAERPEPVRRRLPKQVVRRDPDPALGQWVAACRSHLGSKAAEPARAWLEARGITADMQAEHGIGFDPGGYVLRREDGLPKTAGAVIFPVRNEAGDVIYAQSRDLAEGAAVKYRNPNADIADNPKLSFHPKPSDIVAVTEGIPDALLVNAADVSAVAVLGTGNAMTNDFAERIGKFAEGRPVVLALDADVNISTIDDVVTQLAGQCGGGVSVFDLAEGDITDLWKKEPNAVAAELSRAGDAAEMAI